MVQVPRLKRIQTQSDGPQQTRIKANIRDNSAGIQQATNSTKNLAKQAVNLHRDIENDKIKDLSYNSEKEYSDWSANERRKASKDGRDPDVVWAEYDEKEREYVKELGDRHGNASERIQSHYRANLEKVRGSHQPGISVQRDKQVDVYRQGVHQEHLALKASSLGRNADLINGNDPGSHLGIKQNIAEINSAVAQRSLDNGQGFVVKGDSEDFNHMYTDPDGNVVKVKMNYKSQIEAAKVINNGMYDVIENLSNSGQLDQAKLVDKEYGKHLDSRNKEKVKKLFEGEGTKQTAKQKYAALSYLDDNAKSVKINDVRDPEVKALMRKYNEADIKARKNQRTRLEDEHHNIILKDMVAEKPTSLAALEDMGSYGKSWGKLNGKQQKAITDGIKPPKTSNVKSVLEMQRLTMNGEHIDMPIDKFNEQMAGLSESHQKQFWKIYKKDNTEDGKEERRKHDRMFKQIKTELLLEEEIDPKEGYDIDELNMIASYQQKMFKLVQESEGVFKEAELNAMIKDFVVKEIKHGDDNPFRIIKRKRKRLRTGKNSPIIKVTAKERLRYKKLYKAEHPDENGGRMLRSADPKLLNFMEEQRAKGN